MVKTNKSSNHVAVIAPRKVSALSNKESDAVKYAVTGNYWERCEALHIYHLKGWVTYCCAHETPQD